jgi:hypothetical protein
MVGIYFVTAQNRYSGALLAVFDSGFRHQEKFDGLRPGTVPEQVFDNIGALN